LGTVERLSSFFAIAAKDIKDL